MWASIKTELLLVLTFLAAGNALGDCISDISAEDLALSNLCTYSHSGLIRIDSVILKDSFNPLMWFRENHVYTYSGTVQESFKGNLSGTICLFESKERPLEPIKNIEGKSFVISFDMSQGCSLIDVGGMLDATPDLLNKVRRHIKGHKFTTDRVSH